jgi:hypothetical protein
MKKPMLLAIVANLASLSLGAPAFATSCTAHFNACINNETRMGKQAAQRCSPALKRCLASCKAGKPATFVGPSTGTAFPASECS